ncbi:right-handed parallel beta-helix repeat-containing protein [Isoptericola sp. S6320L]|uniref:right-handed parallel beta-helix repeat-containing protein n=1 Tax=Isoptericola sp. S6320L TaxID=2926411 RepID=UPI001FF21ACD|nr:right-handed parallel beta-helix repeat-containing protein [Isoptericola sp. S6320L]MCK0116494.1 right-handed parallel beta-helix repeat-containing protein [Isoptericola sp. S6320L]
MTPTATRFRASWAVVAAAALTVSSAVAAVAAGPETAFRADDLAAGEYTSDVVAGDFTVKAAEGKDVDVDGSSRTSDRGDEFTQRLKLNGSGTAEHRSLQFTADAPTEVVVHARSGSGSSDRALALFDESWTVVDSVPALADDSGVPVATEVLEVPAAGTYWLSSPSSGVNVYAAQLGADDDVARAPWADVAAPVVDGVTVDPEDPALLDVAYSGLVGTDGADIAHALLFDGAGQLVDRDFTAAQGPSGTISLTPPASGTYEVEVRLTRSGEAEALVSERVSTGAFSLPLVGPEVTGALTTAVSGGQGTVSVEWGATPEAETYAVQTSTDGTTFTTAVDGVTGTGAEVSGLTVGQTYQVRVVAQRGTDEAAGAPFEVTVADAVERWQIADVGSNAGSGGSVTDNGDGTITFDARDSSTKLATSEDGFQYYFTKIDPATENFTLTATFRVDDSAAKDNQSGFGVVAIDDLVAESSPHRYFNSAGALLTRFGDGTEDVVNGMPGARFVHGYTGATDDNTAGSRDQSDSVVFDPDYRPEITGPKFGDGDVYELTLRRSNTGFHAVWNGAGENGEDIEVIQYDPEMLLQQDPDAFYVGMAAARKIQVTVTDWEFTTIHPDDDEPAQERPIEYVPADLQVDVTSTTPLREIEVPLVSTMHGEGQILDADGDVVVDGVDLAPGERELVTVDLEPGENTFTARLLPDADQPQLGEYERIESTDPVDVPLTFTVRSYGEPGESIRVAPDGSPDGAGTQADPLDLHTAVGFAQPGQQVVLADGTYTPQRAVVAERGRNGTEDAPITIMSEPGTRAVLDLSASPDGGLMIRGDWWHVYGLEITGSADKQKPMLVEGHHNVVERVESHHNRDTGIQISGRSTEPPSMWPSHNLVVSSVSHNNADDGGNDADGFAAKLTVGEGNVFRDNIAHHNIDDGWDLFAKSTTGPIGTVVVEDSVAYDNGWLEADPARTGEGNGFKLGGESMPGDHLLRNAVSFGNLATGVTSNSGPDIRLDGVTSVDNERGVRLETNASSTAYEATGVLSWRSAAADVLALAQDDTSLLTDPSNYFDGTTADTSDGRPAEVGEDWFVTTDSTAVRPEIAADGSIEMHGLYELTDVAPSDTGARLVANPDPTEIELLPEVQATLENTVAPSITGDAVKGARLVADPGEWSVPAGYSYRWLRDGEPIGRKGAEATYRVKRADVGHELTVEVTAVAAGADPVVAVSEPVTIEDKGHGGGNDGGHGGWLGDVADRLLDWLRRLLGIG